MLSDRPLLVAQLTDTHLYADGEQTMMGIPSNKSFLAVVEKLKHLQPQPDLLLLTGDLSQDETVASYHFLQDNLIPLSIPTYWIRGNHDQQHELVETILQHSPISPMKAFQVGGWQFVLLNTGVPGRVEGHLSVGTLNWLDTKLKENRDLPTLVALHHPPFEIGSALMDPIKLENSEELFAVLDRYSQVRLVIFGHIHQEFDCTRGGVRYLGSPSTCIQLKPKCDRLALDTTQPGFRLLSLYADGSFETRVERVSVPYQPDFAKTGNRE